MTISWKAFFTADTVKIQETTITPLRYVREGVILKLATRQRLKYFST
nr:MAG TPA: hypothetical protein [Caudoviricetes sp.]